MSLQIIPRATIGCPDPGGRTRLPKVDLVVAHYTGVAGTSRYLGASGPASYTADLADAKSVAAYGKVAGKTWEYNYILGASGAIFEQAGDRQAAHCLGINGRSIGVLWMLGEGREPTPQMIGAWWGLLDHLTAEGRVSPAAELAPHYRYRATSCPGRTLADPPGRWTPRAPNNEGSAGELRVELRARPTAPAPAPTLPGGGSMTQPAPDPTRVTVTSWTLANFRALDTRESGSKPGEMLGVPIPFATRAAMVGITCTQADGAGYITVAHPALKGQAPATSALNYRTGQDVTVIVPAPVIDGQAVIWRVGPPVHLVIDVWAVA